MERFTLPLPEHVRREIVAAGEHSSQLRRGRRAGEGSSRGGRSAPLGRAGRWQSLIGEGGGEARGSRLIGEGDGEARGGRRPACCLRVRIRTAVGTGLLLSPSEWWARCVYEAFFRIRTRYLLEIALIYLFHQLGESFCATMLVDNV